jgi:hypothetical protein
MRRSTGARCHSTTSEEGMPCSRVVFCAVERGIEGHNPATPPY